MAEPFVGEIRLFGGSYAPIGWLPCEGQLLSIFDYDTLYSLLGTTYGGDGENTFALPDLRGRLPIHQGTGPGLSTRMMGETGGSEQVTLSASQMPAHRHTLQASTRRATVGRAATDGLLATATAPIYGPPPASSTLEASTLNAIGQGLPHDNMPPFLALSFIIAFQGIYPSRS